MTGILILQAIASPQKQSTGLRLNHIGIVVKDLDESMNFYTKKMGFREAFRFADSTGKPVVYLYIDQDTFLEMTTADASHPAGFSHAGISADDLESTVASLRQQGVKVADIHVGRTKAPITELYDPNGIRLDLNAYPPESLQRKAMDAWK